MKFSLIILIIFTGILRCSATENKPGLFDNPVSLFQKAFTPTLTCRERGKIETTWRGFYLRSDNQAKIDGMKPSIEGIYLDVEVRDSGEITTFTDSSVKQDFLITRKIKFPAPSRTQKGLVITIIRGTESDSRAVGAINECITDIKKKLGL